MEKFALIVAGGSGTRMGTEIPKQFLELCGKVILMHSIERFNNYNANLKIVVVLPESQFDYWNDLCQKYQFKVPHQLVAGGHSRFQSVRNGLKQVSNDALVFIHDGVRPLVSSATIQHCEETAIAKGNALPVMPIVESIRELDSKGSKHVDRSRFRLVQTPQTFQSTLIKKAFEQVESPLFTDDASVCEAMGVEINLVDGNPENIKITQPHDLKIAEFLLTLLD
ncbi:2-C-methyl-D-erythritol 4-phosphate cytidylyltransferase [Mangrovibacterium sp.]|uniref:2-C-methyl-D-erythritol 4-phosphate cytidylyltransferase n=1 Tax=Mangrovibacterium sp. TaxID=1961364 RepID=UPI0035672F7D